MEILKFENAPAPRKSAPKKNNLKSLAGLATVAAIAVLGSTLAANISLGSGSAIEFGQGVQVTSACDDLITLSPEVTFQNGSNTGVFMLSTVSFSGVDSTSSKCAGKTFLLNAYNNTDATPLQIATFNSVTPVTTATVAINSGGTAITTAAGTVGTVVSGGNSSDFRFKVAFSTPSATSGAVAKLTLQSSN